MSVSRSVKLVEMYPERPTAAITIGGCFIKCSVGGLNNCMPISFFDFRFAENITSIFPTFYYFVSHISNVPQ